MRKMNLKSVTIIIIYAFILTTIFLGSLFYFQKYMYKTNTLSSAIVIIPSQRDMMESYNKGTMNISITKAVSGADIDKYYRDKVDKALLFSVIPFGLFVIISTFGLEGVLLHLQKKEAEEIARSFKAVSDKNKSIPDNSLISATYEVLKGRFEENLNSYKRLHSYLSHEQKNAVSVLRASLEVENNLSNIKCLDALTDSIDDILTLSDNEDISILTEVDVALVCAEVCDTYSQLSDIVFDFNENDNTTIMAKERWIYRAVSNLVDNAIKYSNGKTVSVTVKSYNKSVIVEVVDQGIGMSNENIDKIFDHKYRINELNKNGYGIGLSLVAHVCNLCSGFAWVESEENKGSTFYLSFPQNELKS